MEGATGRRWGPVPAGAVLALDFGLERIGAAVGDTVTRRATPLAILRAGTNDEKWRGLGALVSEWEPVAVAVGVPLNLDGSEQETSRRARRFARQVEGRFNIPVFLVDERYSSAVVERGRERIDDLAAAVILEQWFSEYFQSAEGADPSAGGIP